MRNHDGAFVIGITFEDMDLSDPEVWFENLYWDSLVSIGQLPESTSGLAGGP